MEAVGRSCSPSLSFFLSPYLQPDFNLSKLHHGEKLSQSAVANSSPFAAPNRPLKPCNQLASRYLLRDSGSYFEPLPAPLSLSLSSKEQLEEQRFSTRENGGPIPVSGEALNRANRRERERESFHWMDNFRTEILGYLETEGERTRGRGRCISAVDAKLRDGKVAGNGAGDATGGRVLAYQGIPRPA